MIWADRLGICLGLLWLLWYAAATGHDLAIFLLVVFVLGPWAIGRGLHFIVTGRLTTRA